MKKILSTLLCLPFFGIGQDVYFSKQEGEIIKASNDGLTQTVFYSAPSGANVHAVRVDNINNKIYWNETFNSNSSVSKIMRSDLSNLNPELVLNVSTSQIHKLEISQVNNLIFWSTNSKIWSNQNGLETVVVNGSSNGWNLDDFCIDNSNNYIYFSGYNCNLSRTNFSGQNYVDLGLNGNYINALYMDELNQKIYYRYDHYNNPSINYWDLSNSQNNIIWSCNGWGGNGSCNYSNEGLAVYDFSQDNPTIIWNNYYDHNLQKIKADGSGYQILLFATYPRQMDISRKVGRLEGFVYMDLDSNGVYDSSTEIPLGNQILELEKANGQVSYLTTKADGNYTFEVDTATYTVSYYTDSLWKETSNRTTYNINVGPDTIINNLNFGIVPEYTKADLVVDLTNSVTVCSDQTTLWLNVKNLGTETVTGVTLDLWVNSESTVSSAEGNGVINGNHVSWVLAGDFYPYVYTNQDTTFAVTIDIPGVNAMGNTLIDSARVAPIQQNLIDLDSSNNFTQVSNTVMCSYDPNDKRVVPLKCFYNTSDTLDYTVRFQNTGNYPATTVTIVDTLDLEKLDLMSLEILSASHDFVWSLKQPAILEVVFDNIYLVDSSVSFTESQGFIKYRIQIKDSIADMQTTSTPAYIFFDNNPPIITNQPEINFISDFSTSVSVANESCYALGNISVATNGGTLPYSYQWSSGDTLSNVNNLYAGSYSVVVKDSVGCVDSLAMIVEVDVCGCTDATATNFDPNATLDDNSCYYCDLSATFNSINSATNSSCDGFILANVNSTYPISSYSWSSYSGNYSSNNYFISNLCNDAYFITIVDSVGCSYSDTVILSPIIGCMDYSAFNYNPFASVNDSSLCVYDLNGCTDSLAFNYNPQATNDDGTCAYCDLTLTFYVSQSSSSNSCDGWIFADAQSSNMPISYQWNYNGSNQQMITNLCNGNYSLTVTDNVGCTITDSTVIGLSYVPGCTDPNAYNYDPLATIDDGSCIAVIYGCTDITALNYDPLANTDDGSCSYVTCANPTPTGLHVTDIIHNRARIKWDNMSSSVCTPEQYRIQYRETTTSIWSTKNVVNTNNCGAFNQTGRLITNLNPSTTYEYRVKAWYCNTNGSSTWSAINTFSTAAECPNVGNFSVYPATLSKAVFSWDDSNGPYSFVRIKLRVDSISNPTGADWQNAGGFGVNYGTFSRNKNGLTPNQTYRAQSRTWCDPSGGAYKSSSWTPLIFWMQTPVSGKLESSELKLSNLNIYPNPTRDVVNITFSSEEKQNISIRIVSMIGEEVINEIKNDFVGNYIKTLDLGSFKKGIYLLEIITEDGIFNEKIILQ